MIQISASKCGQFALLVFVLTLARTKSGHANAIAPKTYPLDSDLYFKRNVIPTSYNIDLNIVSTGFEGLDKFEGKVDIMVDLKEMNPLPMGHAVTSLFKGFGRALEGDIAGTASEQSKMMNRANPSGLLIMSARGLSIKKASIKVARSFDGLDNLKCKELKVNRVWRAREGMVGLSLDGDMPADHVGKLSIDYEMDDWPWHKAGGKGARAYFKTLISIYYDLFPHFRFTQDAVPIKLAITHNHSFGDILTKNVVEEAEPVAEEGLATTHYEMATNTLSDGQISFKSKKKRERRF